MKLLVGVMGAEAHVLNGLHQASRETYGSDVAELTDWDMRYFIGGGWSASDNDQPDEVRLDVPDLKSGLLEKVLGMFRWALQHKYDAMLKIDTDSYINVQRMRCQPFLKSDYAGAWVGHLGRHYSDTEVYSFIQGSCSLVSAYAMELVLRQNLLEFAREKSQVWAAKYGNTVSPYMHNEDLWIGQALTPYLNNLSYVKEQGFVGGPFTYHCPWYVKDAGYAPEWMRAIHVAAPNHEAMLAVNLEYENKVKPSEV